MNYIVDTSEARRILDDLKSGRIEIAVPDILPLEILNAIIKGKDLSTEEANKTLKNLLEMPIKIMEISLPVLEKTSKLMKEYDMASYDAYFLALAQYENCQLISDDQKAHGKIKDGSVIMLEDYQLRSS